MLKHPASIYYFGSSVRGKLKNGQILSKDYPGLTPDQVFL